MLDRVSNVVLGLDGRGNAAKFADYAQWEEWKDEGSRVQGPGSSEKPSGLPASTQAPKGAGKKKLSYLEAREFAGIEEAVEAAEDRLQAARERIEDPAVAIDAAKLTEALAEMEAAQRMADELYARWAELEKKQA
jgi:ATP-binding cassette subfamily F protein uup